MEAFALYSIAKALNKEALTLLTVSDSLVEEKSLSHDQRQKGFVDMFKLMLNIVERI
jgi:purine-nucleoside phosphorylase